MDLKDIYSSEVFREKGKALIDTLADYLQESTSQTTKTVIPYKSPAENYEFWKANFEKVNNDESDLFRKVLDRSTRLHHPHYMGHQVVPPAPMAVLGGLLAEFMNNGMAVYEMGMAFNPIERLLCEWLNKKYGFSELANGIITSGGTLGNLTALLTARAIKARGDVWEYGHGQKLGIMVSTEAHYCVDRAAKIMGLGTEGVVKIPVDKNFRLRPELLEAALEQAKEKGIQIFAVVGSAGSTSTGAHEDLKAIGTFAQKHNIWFHVDGAHGGAAIFSPKYKHLLDGIEMADSIVLDFHKMMMVPALATAVLYNNGNDSYQTFHQKAQYLWSTEDQDWQNSGKRTFECTKIGICLKIYALLKTAGEDIFRQNFEQLYDLGKVFAGIIKADPNFELAVEPDGNIVNFRIKSNGDSDKTNAEIRQRLTEKEEFYIVQTNLNGHVYLRVSIMNPLTQEGDLKQLLEQLVEIEKGL